MSAVAVVHFVLANTSSLPTLVIIAFRPANRASALYERAVPRQRPGDRAGEVVPKKDYQLTISSDHNSRRLAAAVSRGRAARVTGTGSVGRMSWYIQ